MKNIINSMRFLILGTILLVSACTGDDEVPTPPPTSENATFTYSYDPDNPNKILFTGQADVDTWYTHWDFGDNSAGEGMEVSKLYFLAGEYDVRFKIFTEGGTAESVQTVSIESDIIGPNLVQNGTFEDDQFWTVFPISNGVDVTFENGAAVWTGGGFGQVGIYQSFAFEPNKTYQINMFISGSGMTDCWFEVYLGATEPTPFQDYTDGGIRLGLNTWEGCGGESFSGLFY
jgi:hypothetical protein